VTFIADVDINQRPEDVITRYDGKEFVVLPITPSFDYQLNAAQNSAMVLNT